jgi:type II secretory pathway component PulC
MAKLEKRQIIILGLTAIVILYAVVDFLMPNRRDTSAYMQQQTEDLNSFITTLTAGMGKDTSKNLRPLIFSRAEREWTRDPFLDETSYKSWVQVKVPIKEEAAAPKIEFVYAGYLEVDRKRIAIINGVEYTEGEALDIKGFVLKSVSPTRVVIENRGTRALLNVPLQE